MLSDRFIELIKTDIQNKTESHEETSIEDKEESGQPAISSMVGETTRVLRGVVRIGLLGKSLLLTGERQLDLVLMCSSRPTVELVQAVADRLSEQLKLL
ncbi:unnamed protein product [Protopolystoma xenopodis]|uniref:DZF domain-containing protein n=1 Tax=Protopolystoma xenopodis TaxID=117903 RepID=A0A448XI79_9PLAT|nr:unnamed protein product [Protopolystoma xenopodis]